MKIRSQIWFLIFQLGLVSSSAFGERSQVKSSAAKSALKSKDSHDIGESSESNREDKTFYIAAGGGLMPYPVRTMTIGLFLESSSILELGLSQYKLKTSTMTDSSDLIHATYRQFFGNSFNISGGLIFGSHSHEESTTTIYFDPGGTATYTAKGSQKTTSIEIRIGNSWQWSHFLLGVDWIGFHNAFSTQSTSPEDKPFFHSDWADVEASMKRDQNQRMELLRFFLGFAF